MKDWLITLTAFCLIFMAHSLEAQTSADRTYNELDKLLQIDTALFQSRLTEILEREPSNAIALGFKEYYNASIGYNKEENTNQRETVANDFLLLSEAVRKSQAEEYSNAINLLKRAESEDLNGRNMWILFEYYKTYLAKGDDYLAWDYLEKLIEKEPTFIPALVEKSYNLDQGQNCNEIIELLEPVVSQPVDSDILAYYGSALNNCGQTSEGIKYLEKSLNSSENKDASRLLGEIYHYQKNDLNKALSYYNKCLSIDSNDIDCMVDMGWLHFSMNNLDEAENAFKNVVNRVNDHEAYAQLIQFYLQSDQLDKAHQANKEDRIRNGNSFYNDGFDLAEKIKRKNTDQSELSQLTAQFMNSYGEAEQIWLQSVIRDL